MLNTIGFEPVPSRGAAHRPEMLPDGEGLYAFLLMPGATLPADVPQPPLSLADRGANLGLLYIGATGDSLRGRVKQHLRSPTPASTMRMSLALLLKDSLRLEILPHSRKRYFWLANEQVLSEWLWSNTMVATLAGPGAFATEAKINGEGGGLLNIAGAKPWPMSRHLKWLRDAAVGRKNR